MPQTTRKHVCTVCSRGFVKAEHLHRHQRSHTGAKPFSCQQCAQTFTRLDSLTRHQQRQGHVVGFTSTQFGRENQSTPQISTHLENALEQIPISSSDSPGAEITHEVDVDVGDMANADPFNDGELLSTDYVEGGLMQLTWPDSEAFLQSILNVNVSSWPENFEALPSRYLFQAPNQTPAEQQSPWLANTATESSASGTHAVRSISQIISNYSSNLASEAESAVLSTTFLEACLHAFFEQITSVLPICHRPTFIFRDWTHPLLLNAIALGSLFMGQDIDIAKGEMLWTLAHTAVATSWHSLILHRGPYDTREGVQLITTALLGQTFAMLSGTSKLRSTAQIFHSLGFYWARQCGLYDYDNCNTLNELERNISEQEKLVAWKRWAAREVQLRALLGHYIIDGQLTYFTGAPTCQRHTSNALPLPSSDALFTASTLREWTEALQNEQPARETFREFFVQLFSGSASALFQSPRVSLLALQVVLEGLQSLVTDSNTAGCEVVGSPSLEAIDTVLYSLHKPVQSILQINTADRLQLLLRWHTVCIDKAVHFNHLCQSLCYVLNVQQSLFGNANTYTHNIDFQAWKQNASARKALLHAFEVRNILSELPVRAIHAIHIPSTLFAAAVVYIAFVVGGVTSMFLPKVADWSILTTSSQDAFNRVGEIDRYLANSGSASATTGTPRNLLYDVNSFVLLTKQLHRPWAICDDIGAILHQMCTKCVA